MSRGWLAAVLLLLLPVPSAAGGYRLDGYRAPTPLELEGAVTVDTDDARALLERGEAVPVDVLPAERAQAGGAFLVPKPRLSLPGAVWLPNVGHGRLSPELEDWFRRRLELLTQGDRSKGLMFYCVIDCWMSWNAAKRAVEWGHGRVYWYPDGTDGWSFEGLPLQPVTPPGPETPR